MAPRTSRDSPTAPLRCAIYTRKSTDEGLDQEFNSLDHQRAACRAFALSQGWDCLAESYDDAGFSGGTMERPALKRLLEDVEARRIDRILIYKLDRLSRSLKDFLQLNELFERAGVSIVSITQSFDTGSSMGRLMLNVLLSFAQFERELVSERTSDKIRASRRRGQWTGGAPLLGYDVVDTRLVVNEVEAAQVRAIFACYLEFGGLLSTAQELNRRGWTTKRWTSRKELPHGGQPFTKGNLHKLLTNPIYVGKVRYLAELHPGQHQALIENDIFERVQQLLKRHGQSGGAEVRNRFGALLKGILRCAPCGCAMSPGHSTKGTKRYRYYVCNKASKLGRHHCLSRSVSAPQIERFVVEQIKRVGRDPDLVAEVAAAAGQQVQQRLDEALRGRLAVQRELTVEHAELRASLTQITAGDEASAARLVELQSRIAAGERQVAELQRVEADLQSQVVDRDTVAATLAQFDGLWDALTAREQVRVIQLLVCQVDYDGSTGEIALHFHDLGIRSLADELATEVGA